VLDRGFDECARHALLGFVPLLWRNVGQRLDPAHKKQCQQGMWCVCCVASEKGMMGARLG
jgi:hypothetical protein